MNSIEYGSFGFQRLAFFMVHTVEFCFLNMIRSYYKSPGRLKSFVLKNNMDFLGKVVLPRHYASSLVNFHFFRANARG